MRPFAANRQNLSLGLACLLAGCRLSAPAPAPGFSQGSPSPPPPTGMAWIPAGTLSMGDASGTGYPDERPVHSLTVDALYMDTTEVPWDLWHQVLQWGLDHGYTFDHRYDLHPGRDPQRPACFVSWFDAIKWCNARSEREGRPPVYRLGPRDQDVCRQGQPPLEAHHVQWDSPGYRLPTEAEWEWAARGGLAGQHFPWPSPGPQAPDWLDGTRANYWQSGDPYESEADCATTPVAYFNGQGAQAPADMANAYGLYDLAGNVAEWCWDWYREDAYGQPEAASPNTRGPSSGHGRVLRGGSWISSDRYCRVSARYMSAPDYRCHCYGLRCVLTADSRLEHAASAAPRRQASLAPRSINNSRKIDR